MKKLISILLVLAMALTLAACGGGNTGKTEGGTTAAEVPALKDIKVGEDYQDITATVKVLTDRTDIVDTVYKGYADAFHELYPNITVEYEAVTDYSESITMRLTTGQWGDICFVPASVSKDQLPDYFIPLGSFEDMDAVYNFASDKAYDGVVHGIPNGGNPAGIVYNKRVWKEAGIDKIPTTPDEFLEDLKLIQDNTDAIPLYTNFAAGWTMGQWWDHIFVSATGDQDFRNSIVHYKDPFASRGDMTGPYAVFYTLYEAVSRGLIEEAPSSTDWEWSKPAINRGEIAAMVLGGWAVAQCQEADAHPEDIGYMPFPITVDGVRYATSSSNYAFAINKKASTDNQIAAMVYLKWLIEESTIYQDEKCIPARKDGEMPDFLSDFEGVNLLTNNAAPAGEETLFDDVNNEAEAGIYNDDSVIAGVVECALDGSKTLDEIMTEWNAKWTRAQEALSVEVNQ